MSDRTLPATAPERLWTSKDVSDFLCVGKNAPADLVRRGDLEAVRIGRRLRFHPATVRAFAARGTEHAAGKVLLGPGTRRTSNGPEPFCER